MTRAALVRNLNSTLNVDGAPLAVPEGVLEIKTASIGELAPALARARDAGVDVLLIDGGDGTVREVLSRVPEIWQDAQHPVGALPRLAILPRGNTNLIAREVGAVPAGRLDEFLARLATGPAPTECRRAMLRADRPGAPPLRGFILGWGAYAEGTRLAQAEIAARGTGQVALAVLSVFRRALIGRTRRALRHGVPAAISIDGAPAREAPRLIGLVTTLQRPLPAGIDPFWGEGAGPIRWLDIDAPGRNLAFAAPFLARGRPRRWMTRAGYASGRAGEIRLGLDSPFVMDGEIFRPPAGRALHLSATEEMVFLSL